MLHTSHTSCDMCVCAIAYPSQACMVLCECVAWGVLLHYMHALQGFQVQVTSRRNLVWKTAYDVGEWWISHIYQDHDKLVNMKIYVADVGGVNWLPYPESAL